MKLTGTNIVRFHCTSCTMFTYVEFTSVLSLAFYVVTRLIFKCKNIYIEILPNDLILFF